MAKKSSFDMKKVKEFLFDKGERLGLGATVAITVLLLVMGFLGISTRPPASAGSPTWKEAFDVAARKADQAMKQSRPPEIDAKSHTNPAQEMKILGAAPSTSPSFFEVGIEPDDKRRNPSILPVSNDIQVDYVLAPSLAYKVSFEARNIMVLGDVPVKDLEPKRMVGVSAAFPYQDQLKEYMNALRYNTLTALLASKDAPHFRGLNVYRTEVGPDGKETNTIALYLFDPKEKKTKVHAPLDKFLRKIVIDGTNPSQLTGQLGPNMVTPLPFLASVISDASEQYPKLKLPGFDQQTAVEEEPGKAKMTKPGGLGSGFPRFGNTETNPGAGAANAPSGSLNNVRWDKINDKELVDRLKGNYNVFDPLGRPVAKTGDEANMANAAPNAGIFPGVRPPGAPRPPGDKQGDGGGAVADEAAAHLAKLLIRFIDIDVQVGKTYRYWIQVRVDNPNFQAKEVAAMDMAAVEELVSGYPGQGVFTPTPTITIPGEMFYYDVDQFPLHASPSKLKLGDTGAANIEHIPVQVHRWIDRVTGGDREHAIGDWVVAERLMVKRGEFLGRADVLVEVPEWVLKAGKFELATSLQKRRTTHAIPVSFLPQNSQPSLVVDFSGGRHDKYKAQKTGLGMRDEAAVELLILDASGKLILHESNDDALNPLRQEHYRRWVQRLDRVGNHGDGGGNQGMRPGGGFRRD